jgi:hypothetical protein
MQELKKTLGFPCPFLGVKPIHVIKSQQVMYLFDYMLELDSSKVHINCDKSWHLEFKFRSVKVQGHVSTCSKMKVSWRGKCIYPKVCKRWQFLSYSSKTFQTCTICHSYISQNTNMGSIIRHLWPLLPLKTSTLCGMAFTSPENLHTLWSCKLRTPYMTQSWVSSEWPIGNTHVTF